MKVSVEDIDAVTKKVSVELPASAVDKALTRAYSSLGKQVRLHGFRPGKVPLRIMDHYYGRMVRPEVTTDLLKESVEGALKEAGLVPLAKPAVESGEVRPGEVFRYSITVEVEPWLEDVHYDVVLPEGEAEVREEDVQRELERYREAMGELEPVEDRVRVESEDVVILDYDALVDGQPFAGSSGRDVVVELDRQGSFMERALAPQLVGLERDVPTEADIDLPQEVAEVGGKRAKVKVLIKEIKRRVLPELDDEFARELGGYESLESLKDHIRKDLRLKYAALLDMEINDKIKQQLTELNPHVEVPPTMLHNHTDMLMDRTLDYMIRQGMDPEIARRDVLGQRDEFQRQASFTSRVSFLIGAVARTEGIEVLEGEVEEHVERLLSSMGVQQKDAGEGIQELARMAHSSLLEQKVLAFLRERSKMAMREGKIEGEPEADSSKRASLDDAPENKDSAQGGD